MGDGAMTTYSQRDLQHYRDKHQLCLDALSRMLASRRFAPGPEQMGLEVEVNLVDQKLNPAMANQTVLELINDPTFQFELGQHQIELNVRPRPLAGDEALGLERELRATLDDADQTACGVGVGTVLIGILPTLRAEHFERRWMSPRSRYARLNEQILAARREEFLLDMEGIALDGWAPERLRCAVDSILPESGCTSLQLHLQVAQDDFAAHWNAAQALAGVQVALAANSPFLLGRALWQETRIPLFEQATDTRTPELRNQGVRPRVWFGERWITSVYDLFEENARYFSPLLPETLDEDPMVALDAGHTPVLSEMRQHNGTIWRWNRPVYDVTDGVPHLRIENRVLPAGPTVIDALANAAFFFGAIRGLTERDQPVWHQMSFASAAENLHAGARHGMTGHLYWPGCGWVRPDQLVLQELLGLAHQGLRSFGVGDAARERYLGVIEQRCVTRRTGAAWQRRTVQALEAQGVDRQTALADMLSRYVTHMHANQPVHSWPLPERE